MAGSRYDAPTPKLIRSEIGEGSAVNVEWEASGSSTYQVTAKGSVVIASWDKSGNPVFQADPTDVGCLRVTCSCPDGQRQRVSSLSSRKLVVCKHAKAALDSVLDEGARIDIMSQKQQRATEASQLVEQKENERKAQLKAQDEQLPGERQRIQHGLEKLGAEAVFEILKTRVETLDGLKALVQVFPTEIMPPKVSERCGRCQKDYDPQISSDRRCRIEHPYDKVRTEWDTSKKSWSCCGRCGKTFHLDGFHSWGKRKRDDPYDEGEYCFDGEHVPEKNYNPDKDPGMQFDNDGDY